MSKAEYKRLGDYIREVNVRNRDLKVTNLLGVNLSKQFFPSIANIIGTDLSKYKIIEKGQFGCKFMSVGRDGILPISLMQDDKPAIISSAYYVFEIKDQNVLLPDYLMMWLRRPEFDRQLWFYSGGDVRGGVNYDDFCEMPIAVPSITRQREMVLEYETLPNRIRLNNQMIQHLEATAQALYRKTFVDNIDKENLPEGWRMGTIEEFGVVITGKTPSSDNPEDFGNDMPFVTPGDFGKYHKFAIGAERELSEIGVKRLKGKVLPKGSVIVTCIGSDMGKVTIASEECITNQQMNSIIVYRREYSDYLFYVLSFMSKELRAMALGSSTMPLLNKSDFEKIRVVYPPSDILVEFSQLLSISNEMILLKMKENEKLTELQSLLLAKMNA